MKDYEKAIREAAHETRDPQIFYQGAKSETAKAFHQQGMYTEDDLRTAWGQGYNKAVSSINEDRFDEDDNAPTFEQWFNKIKSKALPTVNSPG